MNNPITSKIIAAAFKVYNTLGFGYSEKVYENAIRIALSKTGLVVVQQSLLTVYYEGEVVGEFQTDLWVENQIIVELKSVRQLVEAHEVQLVNYLTATRTDIGLLINFGPTGVVIKRKFRVYHPKVSDQD